METGGDPNLLNRQGAVTRSTYKTKTVMHPLCFVACGVAM